MMWQLLVTMVHRLLLHSSGLTDVRRREDLQITTFQTLMLPTAVADLKSTINRNCGMGMEKHLRCAFTVAVGTNCQIFMTPY